VSKDLQGGDKRVLIRYQGRIYRGQWLSGQEDLLCDGNVNFYTGSVAEKEEDISLWTITKLTKKGNEAEAVHIMLGDTKMAASFVNPHRKQHLVDAGVLGFTVRRTYPWLTRGKLDSNKRAVVSLVFKPSNDRRSAVFE
jgi:hypothetical protein